MFHYLLKPLRERQHVLADRCYVNTTWYHFYVAKIYTIQEGLCQTEKIVQKNYGYTEYNYKTSRR